MNFAPGFFSFQLIHDDESRKKLAVTFAWILCQLESCIKKIRAADALAYVGAEDASRASDEYFLQYARLAADTGAEQIRFADTVGCMQPVEVGSRLRRLQAQSPIPIEFHGHKVFGLALANHLAAVKAGIHWHSDTVVSGPAMQIGGCSIGLD